ncbi:6-phosphogluconolactonase [Nocardioides iriomotensis]|uniref:6-phosphogluconolactonase n=1 Tax=Nocardioides iriomotensis TaxID=715784 RepID=A0A4Q5IZ47_9ACTN|nr:6-phosphogluconolactonase [Nocardioides iriomotensis]RYU11412.1 6-phosphogluconolactonase [Nocardioides iriomotensis]
MTAAAQQPEVVVRPDAADLARTVAGALLDLVEHAQAAGEIPGICLTGGTIADAIHREVARQTVSRNVDWRQVELWWGDERYVPADSPDRNAAQARAALLDHVDLDPALVHEMPASDAGHTDVAAAADAFSADVRSHGRGGFDLVMLGVGPDGHVASLFPGYPQLDVDAIALPVTDSPKPPPERITFTFPALNRNRQVWFVASGDGKADAVARALGGADPHDIPAAGVTGVERTVWWLDDDSASAR